MTGREIDLVELGTRVSNYLFVDNELPPRSSETAIHVRFSYAASKERTDSDD